MSNTAMNRLILICRNCTLLGGQSRIAWELAQQALGEGVDVHLVARRFPKTVGLGGIQPHRVFQLPRPLGEWARFRSFASFSSNRADKLRIPGSVTHGFGDSYRQQIITLGNVDWNYAKHIPGRHPDRTAVHVKKRSFLSPDLRFLVLVSQQMRQDILDLLPEFDDSKIRIIYPGVDPSRFMKHSRDEVRSRLSRERGIDPKAPWLVFAAGGDFEKRNIKTLASALSMLSRRPDWKILFVGGSKENVPWPDELQPRTYFLGRLDDVGTVLPGCDLMVYPAWYDESPVVLLESMASALPIITTKRVGTSEVISETNKDVGLMDDPGDAERLAQIISTLLDQPALRARIAQENRQAAQGFAWPNVYQRYRELYNEVAARSSKSSGLGS